ncbi:hypothetical protein F5879DRAFT_1003335 [Lentinula edodes]|nr:hypothetical protein F5879DRAFT_1003335 [Lentinula edodes]
MSMGNTKNKRRSKRLRDRKEVSQISPADAVPSISPQNPPKYLRKKPTPSDPTTPLIPQRHTESLKFRIPAMPQNMKGKVPLDIASELDGNTASEDEVDELASDSDVSEKSSVTKQRKDSSITPPPYDPSKSTTLHIPFNSKLICDHQAIRKAAQAEVRAFELRLAAERLLQKRRKPVAHGQHNEPNHEFDQNPEGGMSEESDEDIKIEIAPAPAPASRKRKNVTKTWSIEDDNLENLKSEDEEAKEKERKSRKKKKGMDQDEKFSSPRKQIGLTFRILIPSVNPGDSLQRRSLSTTATFSEFQDIIYTTLDCKDVRVKPDLSYRLPTASKGSHISLKSEDDWTCCLQDIKNTHLGRPKARQTLPIDVTIVISDQYLHALNVRQNPSVAKNSKSKSKGKRRGSSVQQMLTVINLDGSDGEYDVDDEEEESGGLLSGDEKKQLDALKAMLKQCQKCGREIMCKIDVQGQHVKLSYNMLRAWVIALVNQEHGVTLKQPPKIPLFSQFFRSQTSSTPASGIISTAATPQTPQPIISQSPVYMPMPMPMPMYHPSTWTHPMMNPSVWSEATSHGRHYTSQAGNSGRGPESPRSHLMLSSDPPEEDLSSPYNTVRDFLVTLHNTVPHRGLIGYIDIFEKHDYWNIDEILRLGEEALTAPPFELSRGNAGWLIEKIKAQVKRTDRELKKRIHI